MMMINVVVSVANVTTTTSAPTCFPVTDSCQIDEDHIGYCFDTYDDDAIVYEPLNTSCNDCNVCTLDYCLFCDFNSTGQYTCQCIFQPIANCTQPTTTIPTTTTTLAPTTTTIAPTCTCNNVTCTDNPGIQGTCFDDILFSGNSTTNYTITDPLNTLCDDCDPCTVNACLFCLDYANNYTGSCDCAFIPIDECEVSNMCGFQPQLQRFQQHRFQLLQ